MILVVLLFTRIYTLLFLFLLGIAIFVWRSVNSTIAKKKAILQFNKALKSEEYAESLSSILEINYFSFNYEWLNFNNLYNKLKGLQTENYKIIELIKLRNKYIFLARFLYEEYDYGMYTTQQLVSKEQFQFFQIVNNEPKYEISIKGELYFDKAEKRRIEILCEKIKHVILNRKLEDLIS